MQSAPEPLRRPLPAIVSARPTSLKRLRTLPVLMQPRITARARGWCMSMLIVGKLSSKFSHSSFHFSLHAMDAPPQRPAPETTTALTRTAPKMGEPIPSPAARAGCPPFKFRLELHLINYERLRDRRMDVDGEPPGLLVGGRVSARAGRRRG